MSTMSAFYMGLLDDPDCPVDVQQNIFRWAKATKDGEVLAVLTRHVNLDDDLDTALADINIAKVRAAWTSRPGRTQSEVTELVRREKRVGVLEALASLEDLSDEQYVMIAEKGDAKPPAVALVANPAAPLEAKRIAAFTYGRTLTNITYSNRGQVKATFGPHVEIFDDLARETRHPEIFDMVVDSPDLSPATQANVAKQGIINPLIKASQTLASSQYNNYSAGGSAISTLDLAKRLGDNVTLDAKVRSEVLAFLRTVDVSQWRDTTRYTTPLQKAIEAMEGSGIAVAGVVVNFNQARTSDDIEFLTQIADQAVTGSNRGLAGAIAANPACTADVMRTIIKLLPRDSIRPLLERKSALDVLAVLWVSNATYLTDDALAQTGQPVAALIAVVNEALYRELGQPPYQVAKSRYVTPEIAQMLPMAFLARPELSVSIRSSTSALLRMSFGTRAARWETFETLAESFKGTLSELIAICQAVDVDSDEDALVTDIGFAADAPAADQLVQVDTQCDELTAPSSNTAASPLLSFAGMDSVETVVPSPRPRSMRPVGFAQDPLF